jgi:hypothetical protein
MKTSIVVCLTLAASLVACTEQAETSWGPERSSTTAADLSAVQQCTSQSTACVTAATTPADLAQCEQDLKSCLGALVSEAGVPPLPAFDAGLPPGFSFDAGSLPSFDASFPVLPDSGLPTFPFADGGGVAAASACIQTLQTCLASTTDPATCASQVATCLEQAL